MPLTWLQVTFKRFPIAADAPETASPAYLSIHGLADVSSSSGLGHLQSAMCPRGQPPAEPSSCLPAAMWIKLRNPSMKAALGDQGI